MPYQICNRRGFLKACAATALSAAGATAATAQTVPGAGFGGALGGALGSLGFGNLGGSGQPAQAGAAQRFLPYRGVHTQAFYHTRVVELFEFQCPYCRQINDGAQSWGATLPKPFAFEQMPLVYDKDSAGVASLFYTACLAAPDLKASFIDAAFHLVQDLHLSASDPQTYLRAAAAAGISPQAFVKAEGDNAGRVAYVTRAANFCAAVKPTVTPTFVVADKAIDVQDTGGDYKKLFQLLDGLVSQELVRHQKGAQ